MSAQWQSLRSSEVKQRSGQEPGLWEVRHFAAVVRGLRPSENRQLFDGRPFRILTVVDIRTREAFALVPRVSFRAYQVIDELDQLAKQRGRPLNLQVDNGPEFAGRIREQWVHSNGVEIDFSRPGKPTDDALIEMAKDTADPAP